MVAYELVSGLRTSLNNTTEAATANTTMLVQSLRRRPR